MRGRPNFAFMERFSHALSASPDRGAHGRFAAGGRRLVIERLDDGAFRVEGAKEGPAPRFKLLSEAVRFAREACAAAPATVELRIGDVVAVIRQAAGWPQAICGESEK